MTIKSIAPYSGWYYAAKDGNTSVVFKVAAWALLDTDEVIGMISASGAATSDNVARLVIPPSIKGHYVPEELLDQQQRSAALRG